MAQHLDIAAHRELVVRPPGLEALRRHPRPADAVALQRRPALRAGRRSSRPASRSPDASPATIANARASRSSRGRSAHDAARGARRGSRSISRDVGGRLGRRCRRSAPIAARGVVAASGPRGTAGLCICLTAAMRSAREAAPPQAFGVDAAHRQRVAVDHHEGRHVLRHVRSGSRSWRARRSATNWCTPVRPPRITQSPTCTWPASVRVVGEDGVVADLAVVRDVHVGHDPVVVADARHAGVLRRAEVEACRTRGWCCGRRSPARVGSPRVLLVLRRARRASRTGRSGCRGRSSCGPRSRSAAPTVVPAPIRTSAPIDGVRADLDVVGRARRPASTMRRRDGSFAIGAALRSTRAHRAHQLGLARPARSSTLARAP